MHAPTPLELPLAPNARWIWAPQVTGANTYVEFRHELSEGKDVTAAWIQLSAETSLRLFVNGRLVHGGPAREVAPYFYFDTIDLRSLLVTGPNELRIVAHHQGENSQSYQKGPPAILVAGRCVAGSKLVVDFAETASWQARRITSYRADAPRLFFCLGFSEHVDFQRPAAAFGAAEEVALHPWAERPTALANDLPPWRENVRKPLTLEPSRDGWLIDMGQEVSGFVELSIWTKHAISLRIAYSEALIDGRVVAEKAGMQYADRLDIGAGEAQWRSYEKRAFRYLHLDSDLVIRHLRVVEQTYPYEPVFRRAPAYGANQASKQGQLLNRILEVSARTIELNSEDLLTDCPRRERAQYLDCQYYMAAMQQLFGTLEPIRRFLHQYPRGADTTLMLRMCYPSPAKTEVIPDFSISYAILLQRYLRLSGDIETVRKNIPFAERGVTAFRPYEDKAGLLTHVPGWIFLDNTFEMPKYPRSAGLNAVYYGGQRALAELLRACDEPDRAIEFEETGRKLRASFREAFLADGRLLDADSSPLHETHHQWVYHYSAESGQWHGRSFRLRVSFRRAEPRHALRLAVHAGGRAWIDGALCTFIKKGGTWSRSAIYEAVDLTTPDDDRWHWLDLEVEWSSIDWECYLSSAGNVEWSAVKVWAEAEFGACAFDPAPPDSAFTTALRRHVWPWLTQITVGYAAFHGLLEDHEAKRLLHACLPDHYSFPYAKRTTPFFATITDQPDSRRILPCNVPASMFHFCHALKRYGMAQQARELLLRIYQGMLAQGATTWWEEWNNKSSLCHAWASFVVEIFDETSSDKP